MTDQTRLPYTFARRHGFVATAGAQGELSVTMREGADPQALIELRRFLEQRRKIAQRRSGQAMEESGSITVTGSVVTVGEAGANILAPCPHARPCPLAAPDWCHFSARVARSRLHREAGLRLRRLNSGCWQAPHEVLPGPGYLIRPPNERRNDICAIA